MQICILIKRDLYQFFGRPFHSLKGFLPAEYLLQGKCLDNKILDKMQASIFRLKMFHGVMQAREIP